MNRLKKILFSEDGSQNKYLKTVAIVAPVIIAIGASTLHFFTSIASISPAIPSIKHMTYSGSQRIYLSVKKGDRNYHDGNYQIALDFYTDARETLREFQNEYPKKSLEYRDAERVVQSRIYLADTAVLLKQIKPNNILEE